MPQPQSAAAQEGVPPLTIGDPPAAELVPFFEDARYDPAILDPDAVLGRPLGTRMASHEEVLAIWHAWAEQSPRVLLESYGRTYEGRELLVGIVTSTANRERLDAIRDALSKLADPSELSSAEEEALIRATPAVAWMGYSIHGDETSGVDAGLAFARHLVASRSDAIEALLERTVVVIDPCMNPDGRERFRAMTLHTSGAVANLDDDSLHRGRWPWGRGNHYLFDMNRDWMAGIAPETRGRWSVLGRYPPQLFVDAHEMGSRDTYLFYPQAEPRNPYLPERLGHWQDVLADAQGAAFDRRGWSYYTREWADAWAPFYSDAWGSLGGAIGMLYEQASYAGQSVRRPSGELATYREAVWHQAVASLASVQALSEHRDEVLRDFVAFRRANLSTESPGRARVLAVIPGRHPRREAWLVETLVRQGVAVHRSAGAMKLARGVSALGEKLDELALPEHALIVPAAQPAGSLVLSYFDFDPRLSDEALLEERLELERKGSSKIYDLTSWCLAHALDLDAWWCDAPAAAEDVGERIEQLATPAMGIVPLADLETPVYGWIVDGFDDGALSFAARALEQGLAVAIADEPLQSAGRSFARWSVLVRRHENGPEVAAAVERAAREAGVEAVATAGARSGGAGPDLGGQRFHLLARPRIALVSGQPVSSSEFGHLWHLIDRELGLPLSLLEATSLPSYDLRRYNVLVLPPAGDSLAALLEPIAKDLEAWVRSGGTLIAVGDSAGVLAQADLGLSEVRRLGDVLDELEAYRFEARRERSAREPRIDPSQVWGPAAPPAEAEARPESEEKGDDASEKEPDAEREDRWRSRFMPRGATLLGLVDDESWIAAGCLDRLAVLSSGDLVLLAREPVRTAVRLAPAADLRLSGLLWPEARERLAESAWLTVERKGHGQVVLFAAQPGFRGFHKATGRLFANAVVYGPGVGADPPQSW